MTPPTAVNGTRRQAECPVCGRTFMVRADGLLKKHYADCTLDACVEKRHVCAGSYVDCTGEGTAT